MYACTYVLCVCVYVCVCVCVCLYVCVYVHMCVCIYVCTYQCPCCQPLCGRHGNTSFACLMMWLTGAPLSLTMWQRPGGVRDLLCWQANDGTHNAYTSCNVQGSACTWTSLLTQSLLLSMIHPPFWGFFYLATIQSL